MADGKVPGAPHDLLALVEHLTIQRNDLAARVASEQSRVALVRALLPGVAQVDRSPIVPQRSLWIGVGVLALAILFVGSRLATRLERKVSDMQGESAAAAESL